MTDHSHNVIDFGKARLSARGVEARFKRVPRWARWSAGSVALTALWMLWPTEGAHLQRTPDLYVWATVLLGSSFGAVWCAIRGFAGSPLLATVGVTALLLWNGLFALFCTLILLGGGGAELLAVFLLY